RAVASVRRYPPAFLRRPPLREERGVARHGARARPPELQELVPRQLSVCLRKVPNGSRLISPPTYGATSRSRRNRSSRSTCTTRSARRCSRRSAVCRGTASPLPSSGCCRPPPPPPPPRLAP